MTELIENRPDFAAEFLSPLSDEEKDQLAELLGKLVGRGGPEGDLGPEPEDYED